MKCPRCGAWSNVAETRPAEHQTTRRRRECANGHRFTTVEIQAAAYGTVKSRLADLAATMQARWKRWRRDTEIVRQRSAGETLLALGPRHGLTPGAIAFVLKRMGR